MEGISHLNHSHAPSYIQEIPPETLKASSKISVHITGPLPSRCRTIVEAQPQDTSAFWHCCQSRGGLRHLGWRTGIISVFFTPLLSQTLSPYFMVKAISTFSFRFPGAKVSTFSLVGSIELWVSNSDCKELVSGQGAQRGILGGRLPFQE